jgi:hypothetical protein
LFPEKSEITGKNRGKQGSAQLRPVRIRLRTPPPRTRSRIRTSAAASVGIGSGDFLSFVGVAFMKASDDPLMDILCKMQPADEFGEFRGDDLLANIGLVAFSLVAGAVIVDVAPLLRVWRCARHTNPRRSDQ